MSFQTIRLELQDEISIILLDRPKQMNSINQLMIQELNEAINIVENDDEIKVLMITGNERVFAAGADIVEMLDFSTAADFQNHSKNGHALLQRIEKLGKPSIAVVRGIAFGGGCEFSLACDFRIAANDASFCIPEIKLGLIPGWGGASRLQKLLPFPIFKELLLTGEPLKAVDAAAFGLVNRVVPSENAMDAALQFASLLINKSSLALRMAKDLANTQWGSNLSTAIELETLTVGVLAGAEDRIEGINAFIEKRKPIWSNR